ncbi:protein O-GlcNAcase isoform X2 [Denticeps clupeoides]|uniref:protein O-GlcNAcase isoform X2 n=1 Tax=Denticeps clupeoides TaxID=299321 RepID=UPI0010A4FE2E|nr:protein O-GlcNAcase-like isoform X2 [Denticeps clupeoides]
MEERSAFLCGVVEGFYGRPWSMDQRKVLFRWMQNWGLNTYLYGPKDDLKHRLLWRELYTGEEEVHVKALILEAKSRGLCFVYSISPGQDIVFSSSYDVSLLKRKLRQVADLGCQAFAILFDDIDHSMCQADTETFSSFAHAQVSVANEVFCFLGEPSVFLFCPTEYCSSICSPSVSKSPYLQTVGEELLPGVSIIWTGNKVISHELSSESLAEVQTVLQRPPLVWDNLHANDYDSRRVFLGPYKGRALSLCGNLTGVLLNPNCEFEANFIPLHTLGTWHQAGKEERKDEGEQYCPERALNAALRDWLEELSQPLQPGRQVRPTDTRSCRPSMRSRNESADDKPDPTSTQPIKTLTKTPQDCDGHCPTHAVPQKPNSRNESPAVTVSSKDKGMRMESWASRTPRDKAQGRRQCSGKNLLNESQVRLLVGLHYLPHEHGPPAKSLLQDLTWLKANCHYVSANGNKKKIHPQKADEWRVRAGHFQVACDEVALLHESIVNSINRAVLYDLYPYVWDLRNTLLVAKAFVIWLEGRFFSESFSGSWKDCFHWCGTTAGSELVGVESEPWAFKGGLSGELQALLPMGTSSDLFIHPPPLFPTSHVYNIRPFYNKDKVELYHMVHQLYERGQGSHDSSLVHPDYIGDLYLGAALALCPEYSFVLEDELGVCGCVLGILDVRYYSKRCQASWIPAMRDKYPSQAKGTNGQSATKLRLDGLPELMDCSVSRSLLTTLLTALKANGSRGVFCEVPSADRLRLEFLTKLGFLEIMRFDAHNRDGVVLGRLL